MSKIKNFLRNSWIVKGGVYVLKKIAISKKRGISLYTVLSLFFRELKDKDLQSEANGVAFNFTLALFPALLFLFSLISYLPVTEVQIMEFMEGQLPTKFFDAMEETIRQLATGKQGILLVISILLSLFLSTNGMVGIIDAFNRIYRTREKRKFIRKRLVALILTIATIAVFCTSVTVLAVSKIYLESLNISEYKVILIQTLEFIVVSLVFFLCVSLIYYFAPTVQKRFRFFSLGSAIATILGITATSLFFWFLNSGLATYNKVYGSIGTLIALMIWIKVLSTVLLIGFEINAGLDRFKRAQDIDDNLE